MAKIYGLFGSMKGKVADVVMAVRNGTQIVRKYQPMVYNPSTAGQVAARAKLKLLSQLSAVFGSTIAIPREGIVSARNIFTRENYGAVSYEESSDPPTASVNLSAVKLTRSTVFLPEITATASGLNARALLSRQDVDIDRVVYNVFAVAPDKTLRLGVTGVISSGGEYTFEFPVAASTTYAIYAYGIRINSDAARTKFNNMQIDDATFIASLIANRELTAADVTLTETKYASLVVE